MAERETATTQIRSEAYRWLRLMSPIRSPIDGSDGRQKALFSRRTIIERGDAPCREMSDICRWTGVKSRLNSFAVRSSNSFVQGPSACGLHKFSSVGDRAADRGDLTDLHPRRQEGRQGEVPRPRRRRRAHQPRRRGHSRPLCGRGIPLSVMSHPRNWYCQQFSRGEVHRFV